MKAKFQVQILARQLGGKQSPGSIPCIPPISHSCSPIGRGGCLKTSQRAGSNPARSTNYAAVAQLEEVLVLETRGCGFNSRRHCQIQHGSARLSAWATVCKTAASCVAGATPARPTIMESNPIRRSALFAKQMDEQIVVRVHCSPPLRTWCNWMNTSVYETEE